MTSRAGNVGRHPRNDQPASNAANIKDMSSRRGKRGGSDRLCLRLLAAAATARGCICHGDSFARAAARVERVMTHAGTFTCAPRRSQCYTMMQSQTHGNATYRLPRLRRTPQGGRSATAGASVLAPQGTLKMACLLYTSDAADE